MLKPAGPWMDPYIHLSTHCILIVDLRTAQVYCAPIFWSARKCLKISTIFVGKIVGGVGGEGIYRN